MIMEKSLIWWMNSVHFWPIGTEQLSLTLQEKGSTIQEANLAVKHLCNTRKD